MRVGVDVMGGDHAPRAILDGAIAALDQLASDDQVVLVGDQRVIDDALASHGVNDPRLVVVGTTQTIAMDESPVEAVRTKPDSSIAVLAELASPRKAARRGCEPLDVMLSAGNTGACISASQMHMRRLRHVHRPGIAVTIPTFTGPVVLIDAGANIEPKPHHLAQYGVMGDVYARRILNIEKPRVALMNVGGEEQKGTADMKRARDLLRSVPDIDFIGYVEGRGVFNGEADVIVTDGVVGNVMIKLAEGLSEGIFRTIVHEIHDIDPALAKQFQPVIKQIRTRHDYHEYGGAPLLGVNGVCLIAHGSSEARTFTNALVAAGQFVQTRVNDTISERLGVMEEAVA
jgi:glycerol-3-phosphate acyltransferase PlsX